MVERWSSDGACAGRSDTCCLPGPAAWDAVFVAPHCLHSMLARCSFLREAYLRIRILVLFSTGSRSPCEDGEPRQHRSIAITVQFQGRACRAAVKKVFLHLQRSFWLRHYSLSAALCERVRGITACPLRHYSLSAALQLAAGKHCSNSHGCECQRSG